MKTFYAGIKGVIVRGDKVLILHANKAHGRKDFWEMPGGRINDNEAIEQALRRELTEELPSIKDVEIHEILHAHRLAHDIDGKSSLVLIYYRVTAKFSGDVPTISEEHINWQWADKATALRLTEDHIHPAILRAINHND